jgi:hypothetical protein
MMLLLTIAPFLNALAVFRYRRGLPLGRLSIGFSACGFCKRSERIPPVCYVYILYSNTAAHESQGIQKSLDSPVKSMWLSCVSCDGMHVVFRLVSQSVTLLRNY